MGAGMLPGTEHGELLELLLVRRDKPAWRGG
jgi:hypothetical protein